ncbi:MAG: ABC-F family ATP-binding cassette domain-containing protein [Bacteroidetes bacterium]|nr:ABC-F family ATP-binding cassette domain-containing protein [Bacteroidota bacterium]
MNVLLVENLSKSYGEKILFENITFGIDLGSKIALIAKNGTGKTSLLNIIVGKDIPDDGKVVSRKDINISYLPQNPSFDENEIVVDVLLHTENPVVKAIKYYEKVTLFHDHENQEDSLKKIQEATEQMDILNAWDYESKIKEVLSKLDINNIDKPIGVLSGGQKKRLALAKVLIEEPDLLILDEPTNHLDIEMIEWLEVFLNKQKITLLLVTHDRYFLDRVCNEVIELDNEKIYQYKGNYTYFLEKKAEREFNEAREIEKARNLLKTELEWMRRMPQARTTKSKARIDSFYVLKDKASAKNNNQDIKFTVNMNRMGSKILELSNICKKYDDLILLENFSYIFKKGEKIGIIGGNGIGKSTLLNIITENIRADAGKISVGETIVFGYFNQDGLSVDEDKTVLEIVKDIAEYIPVGKGSSLSASQFLVYFNFPHAIQHNPFSKLSGGERRRLHLVTVLMKNPNFLILDEPTNDLDIHTLNVLEDFLNEFNGCVLIVSHDRYFIDKIADHVFVFEGNGRVKDFYGNYTDYNVYKEEQLNKQRNIQKETKRIAEPKQNIEVKSKPTYKEQKEFEALESDIASLEDEKKILLEKMNLEPHNFENINKWSLRIGEIMESLEEKTNRWIELSEKFEV